MVRSMANWIQGAIKNPGYLRRKLGAKKGQGIPLSRLQSATKQPGHEGKAARLAVTLRRFH